VLDAHERGDPDVHRVALGKPATPFDVGPAKEPVRPQDHHETEGDQGVDRAAEDPVDEEGAKQSKGIYREPGDGSRLGGGRGADGGGPGPLAIAPRASPMSRWMRAASAWWSAAEFFLRTFETRATM
jgi:hypothetical protein